MWLRRHQQEPHHGVLRRPRGHAVGTTVVANEHDAGLCTRRGLRITFPKDGLVVDDGVGSGGRRCSLAERYEARAGVIGAGVRNGGDTRRGGGTRDQRRRTHRAAAPPPAGTSPQRAPSPAWPRHWCHRRSISI